MKLETLSEQKAFGGTQGVYRHDAKTVDCPMEFSVFVPEVKSGEQLPVVWYLSGLTCTQENATTKAGFQRVAAELGLIIVCPDTSPRGDDVANDEAYDLGQGAGFYLNATQAPWASHFHMYDYVTEELPALVAENFPVDLSRQGITGHSMGGHGALTIALKNADTYKSISAFAPIVAPMEVPWGQKAFTSYLGADQSTWAQYDACQLMRGAGNRKDVPGILIDQGTADAFLEEQLVPQKFAEACGEVGQELNLRLQEGYDHSYYLMATFMEDHLRHHAHILKAE